MERNEALAIVQRYVKAADEWHERVHHKIETELGLDALSDEALELMAREYLRLDGCAVPGTSGAAPARMSGAH